MGMNVHDSVASVSMESLVERRVDATKDARVGSQTATSVLQTSWAFIFNKGVLSLYKLAHLVKTLQHSKYTRQVRAASAYTGPSRLGVTI